jgi:hypothetical protein
MTKKTNLDRRLDEVDFKKEFPKEYYQGYDRATKIYNMGHNRNYIASVEKENPYSDRLPHWAWFSGLYDGYDESNKNDIKTNL